MDSRLLHEDPEWLFSVSLKTTITASISISLPLSSHPPLSDPKVASVGNYHYVFIQGQPTEEAVVLALSAGVLLAAWRGGRKEGWMSAEDLYSCLQARPHLSRPLLWRWSSCHHTKQLHEGQLSLSLFLVLSVNSWLSLNVCSTLLFQVSLYNLSKAICS